LFLYRTRIYFCGMNVLKWLGYVLILGLFIWFVFFRQFNPFASKTDNMTSTTTQDVLSENTLSDDIVDDAFVDENTDITSVIDDFPETNSTEIETPKNDANAQSSGIDLNQRYLIVVGSFGKKANADRMLKRVLNDGNQGVIKTVNGLHRVITGSTDDLSNAKKLRDHFTHIYKETAFILEN
jgi:hypothetical protein